MVSSTAGLGFGLGSGYDDNSSSSNASPRGTIDGICITMSILMDQKVESGVIEM